MKPGDKINFEEGNRVRFFMDYRLWEGMPSDTDFFLERDMEDDYVELWADGYGGGINGRPGSYGNGSIFARKEDLPAGAKSE